MRIVVLLANPPLAPWHRTVVDRLRAEPAVEVSIGEGANADAIVDLTGASPAAVARLGIWRYGFANGSASADGAAGTLARLHRLTADPSRVMVLREGWFRAASGDAPGIDDVGASVANWCALAVRQAIADGEAVGPTRPTDECGSSLPPVVAPGVLASTRDAYRRWKRRERWTIGVASWTAEAIVSGAALSEPRWLEGIPDSSYLADPFPQAVDGDSVTLFAEQYRFREGRGRIVSVEAGRDGRVRSIRPVIEPPYHIAYPFTVRDGDETMCVADAEATGTASAFRVGSSEPPLTLVQGFPAADPTLVQHAGRWWLFCTQRGPLNQTDLYVFHAPEWRGPWWPHAMNPVKSDARSSRPAGAFFTHGGVLFRPAQDCSRRYGGALAINRVVDLSTTRFREETVRALRPGASWAWPDGMHTLNLMNDLAVVDALRVER